MGISTKYSYTVVQSVAIFAAKEAFICIYLPLLKWQQSRGLHTIARLPVLRYHLHQQWHPGAIDTRTVAVEGAAVEKATPPTR